MNCLDNKVENIFKLKESKEIFRLGKLFNTEKNHYFYDIGTGKVLQLDEDVFKILDFIFYGDNKIAWREFEESLDEKALEAMDELNKIIEEEDIFNAPVIDRLYTSNHYENLENSVNNNLMQVIIEVTGKCNLRCGYCIYNEDYSGNRNFNNSDMNIEIAKAAIDYTKEHAGEEIAVTFYGGEPLVKFDLLKWCIEYAKETIKDKKLTFAFTTNLTLVTEEIANYFASVDNVNILCSLDGPEDVQNSYRKYIDGRGSFKDAIRGLKYLVNAFKNNPTNSLSINGVFAPPYTFEKVERINEFFQNLEWLPKEVEVNINYVSPGTVDDKEHIKELIKDPRYNINGELINVLEAWGEKKLAKSKSVITESRNVLNEVIKRRLLAVHNRRITRKAQPVHRFNSCCVPGSRRLYIDTKGDFYVCERVGSSPSIGNVFEGIDFNKIKKYYIKDYSDGSIDMCSQCWTADLCNECYMGNYTKEGFNREQKIGNCSNTQNMIEECLVLYHSILENTPEKLDDLNKMRTM
ncbi:anaerobic sulfatase-maturating enzyme [Clostridium puniceum]|uniref:Anaerobic sulfatase-maturating enzyme n=1 Tax=Clostridium puniceum TaxID=29367 RepID=A0A1S8TW63_9CLOT|nr:radical SAM protein [Clostridium puniceum]OOM82003.1 anaerobic sulfatase-maturating enzyme [Clostridium puniceum]